MGSPRKNGNTAALLRAFMEENRDMGIEQDMIWLYDRTILPCLSCKQCQSTPWGTFGCPQEDDMQAIFDSVQTSEVLILASPIYSWYCTPPMKAVMDRLLWARGPSARPLEAEAGGCYRQLRLSPRPGRGPVGRGAEALVQARGDGLSRHAVPPGLRAPGALYE